jgi:hypothetical protein
VLLFVFVFVFVLVFVLLFVFVFVLVLLLLVLDARRYPDYHSQSHVLLHLCGLIGLYAQFPTRRQPDREGMRAGGRNSRCSCVLRQRSPLAPQLTS